MAVTQGILKHQYKGPRAVHDLPFEGRHIPHLTL